MNKQFNKHHFIHRLERLAQTNYYVYRKINQMNKKTSIALFLATTSVVALTSTGSSSLKAEESDLGGLKEWNTDMPLEADFILDEQAQKLADEAAKASVCVPIGEGENCW